ncbi:MAG TPA: type III-B CRISPR module RAMP protein Cmr4, partial [Gemmata sp.]|nr:type III-B CRISPR module RAMP protein Cmr4 [Gemmata sp.]
MSDAPTRQTARLLFLHAQTGLHPGSGTALGVVDLPVQRERHTDFPTIPGSALKGVLRDRCRETAKANHGGDRKKANEEDRDLLAAFGPGKGSDASDHAGALAVTDARLVAFPVRSLRGVFAWVTCPDVLVRLNRDLRLAGMQNGFGTVPEIKKDTDILCPVDSPLLVNQNKVVLEEFEYSGTGPCEAVTNWFANNATTDLGTAARLKTNLAVISNNAFTHYARYATEIVARVGLDYATKTVKEGALFYQEVL